MVSLPRIVLYQRISELERELYTDAQRNFVRSSSPQVETENIARLPSSEKHGRGQFSYYLEMGRPDPPP